MDVWMAVIRHLDIHLIYLTKPAFRILWQRIECYRTSRAWRYHSHLPNSSLGDLLVAHPAVQTLAAPHAAPLFAASPPGSDLPDRTATPAANSG